MVVLMFFGVYFAGTRVFMWGLCICEAVFMAAGAVGAAGQIIWAQWPLIQLSLASAPATVQISAGREKAASCHRCSRSAGRSRLSGSRGELRLQRVRLWQQQKEEGAFKKGTFVEQKGG